MSIFLSGADFAILPENPRVSFHTAMGKKRDGKNGRLPKHNNDFKFKHNPKSKKSDLIATITHSGLCHRCSDKIAWKKKYRKYKQMKRSGKCYMCEQRNVKRSYHTICAQCSLDNHCCAWCKLDFNKAGSGGVVVSREERVELAQIEGAKLNEQLSTMRERDRRSVLRRMQRSESEEDSDEEDGEDMKKTDGQEDGAEGEGEDTREVCRNFLKGRCSRDNCKFKHQNWDEINAEGVTADAGAAAVEDHVHRSTGGKVMRRADGSEFTMTITKELSNYPQSNNTSNSSSLLDMAAPSQNVGGEVKQ